MDTNANAKVVRLLREACTKAGSQNAWAKQHGITQQYVNQVLTGRSLPGPRILSALGVKRVIRIAREEERV